jgi:phage tail protein X
VRQTGGVLGVALAIVLVGAANPGVADFQHLFLAHIALSLLCGGFAACIHQRRPVAPAAAPSPTSKP